MTRSGWHSRPAFLSICLNTTLTDTFLLQRNSRSPTRASLTPLVRARSSARATRLRTRRAWTELRARTKGVSEARVGERERSEEHTSELQSLAYLVCRLLLEKK